MNRKIDRASHRAPRLFEIAAILVLVFIFAAPATADDTLSNGDFDSNIDGWTIGDQRFIDLDWGAIDRDAFEDSGSLAVFGAIAGFVGQCVDVDAGATYEWGGSTYEFNLPGNADYSLRIVWYDALDCGGSSLGEDATATVPAARNVWHDLTPEPVVAPAGAASADFQLVFTNVSGGFSMSYDAVHLPEPSGPTSALVALVVVLAIARTRPTRPTRPTGLTGRTRRTRHTQLRAAESIGAAWVV